MLYKLFCKWLWYFIISLDGVYSSSYLSKLSQTSLKYGFYNKKQKYKHKSNLKVVMVLKIKINLLFFILSFFSYTSSSCDIMSSPFSFA